MYVSVSQESPNFLIDLLPIDKLGVDSTFPGTLIGIFHIVYYLMEFQTFAKDHGVIIETIKNPNHFEYK